MAEKVPHPVIPGKLIVGPNYLPLGELARAGATAIVDLNQDDDERAEAERFHMRYYENKKIRIPDDSQPIPVEMLHDIVKVLSDFIGRVNACIFTAQEVWVGRQRLLQHTWYRRAPM